MLGFNPNTYKNLTLLKSKKPEELELTIRSIQMPVHVVSIYYADGLHCAWIVTQRKLIQTIKKEKKNEKVI